jgi:hypothetical protein
MINWLKYNLLFILLLLAQFTYCQDSTQVTLQDTVSNEKAKKDSNYRSPKRAVFLSAILPGAGQVYNHAPMKGKRNLWKLPFIYAGLGTSTYFLFDNIKNYKSYRAEYIYRLDCDTCSAINYPTFSVDNLRTAIDQYKNWKDMSVVIMAGIYVLQLVDASVSAHLFNHDISPNLTLRIAPTARISNTSYVGMSFTLFRRH